MKPFLNDKYNYASEIPLKYQRNVIHVYQELAEMLNNFFKNVVDDLEIKPCERDIDINRYKICRSRYKFYIYIYIYIYRSRYKSIYISSIYIRSRYKFYIY